MAARLLQGGTHFGARFDAGLLGDPLLERTECQVGRDHAGLALAEDLEQVLLGQGIGVVEIGMACVAQLDGHGIEFAGTDHAAHVIGTLGGDMRSAQQGVAAAPYLDDAMGAAEGAFLARIGHGILGVGHYRSGCRE